MFADTFRSPELRHEVPLGIPDPFLYAERDGFRFSSVALREALLVGMDEVRKEQNHRRLGEAFDPGENAPAAVVMAAGARSSHLTAAPTCKTHM